MKGYYLMPHPPIMLPEVGRGEERKIEATIKACEEVGERIKQLGIETIIIISPHGVVFQDGIAIVNETYLEGDLRKFGVNEASRTVKIDLELNQQIIQEATEKEIVTVPLTGQLAKQYGVSLELDHGAMVPLAYMKSKDYKIVHITYGLLTPLELYQFGEAIARSVEQLGRKAVLIASGDLSHRLKEDGPYEYSPYGVQFDKKLMGILEAGDMKGVMQLTGKLVSEAGECGLRSLYILAGALDGKKVQGEILSYEGPFGVGYGVVDFHFKSGESIYEQLLKEREANHRRKMKEGNPYTQLARLSLDYFFTHHQPMPINEDEWPELCNQAKGVFVSIKKAGDLRGCIGTTVPTTSSIAHEVVQNAISAATKDPRFSPMNREELLDATISVDVLEAPESATKEKLDPQKYGVIVRKECQSGLLLPRLEGIDTVEQQLQIALQKAGLTPYETYDIQRFEVKRYEEEENHEKASDVL